MAEPCCGQMSPGKRLRLDTANVPEKIMEENGKRKKYLIENRGPGTVFVGPTQDMDTTRQNGIRILNGGSFIDDATPVTHCLELWGVTDAANTDLLITEWI